MSLNLNHLAVFHAVAEAGGVTRGAERLLVSQPAVSKQLKELERRLGCRLLERHGRGVRLTEAGRVLASCARDVFERVAEAEASLSDVAALRRGRLAVGTTPTIGTYLLPEALVYFRQRFPGIRVEVETAGADLLHARLSAGAIELALGDETLVIPGMQRRLLTDIPFVAVAAPTHPLARRRRRPVSLNELTREPMVNRESDAPDGSFVERHLARLGIAAAQSFALGTTEAVKRAVQAGLGLAILPRLAVAGEAAAGTLVVLRVPELKLSRPLYEVWDDRRPRGKAAQAFHCVLEHAVRGTLPPPRRTPRT